MHPKDKGLVQGRDVSCWGGCQARQQPLKVATDDMEVAALSPHAAPCGPRTHASRGPGTGQGWSWVGRPDPGGGQRGTHIGREEEDDSVGGSLQRQASDEEDGQDDIGQRRSDIHGLGTGQAWDEGGDGAQEETGLAAQLPPASHCRVCNEGYSVALTRARLWTSLACSFLITCLRATWAGTESLGPSRWAAEAPPRQMAHGP